MAADESKTEKPSGDHLLEVSVFKLTRAASKVKHTGVLFAITPPSSHASTVEVRHLTLDYGPSKATTAGCELLLQEDRPQVTLSKVVDLDAFLGCVETLVLATSSSVTSTRADTIIADILHHDGGTSGYHLIVNNCRTFCRAALDRLKGAGLSVRDEAWTMVKDVERNDALIAGAVAVGVGVAALIARLVTSGDRPAEDGAGACAADDDDDSVV